ncbi:penicillin amidase [Mucilaginibacter sp. PPCGB 2223]|uniref:penicillin acylase family protein n=1 Tax=Mucilaginibacter sp. PPCGB 2223 TaxID=1886027 RepID=UPI0008254ACA|nr:penicillin acylase family protein [Mucilaginibacter sp. PPCGB 2223]OCX53506.1 penicillin amidase [Mucilaginibacter sp. PPCGB 2223]
MLRLSFFCTLLSLSIFCSAQKLSKTDVARCQGEAGRVTIIRDNWGVPHIYAKTDADVVFGLLYSECEDNFKGVERNYLNVLGRTAEADGEKAVYTDLLMRLAEDSTDAIKDYKRCAPAFKKLLDAFADGINYYLYKHPEVKPAVLTRFKPWYALMFTDGSVGATITGGATVEDVRRFYGNDEPQLGYDYKINDELIETGSNGFAISPSKTASGNAMLYINPHVPFYFRSEVELVSQEGLHAYGAVTWGQFFVYQGFNRHCGWMHTTSNADVADLYAEKISHTGNRLFYEYEHKQLPVRPQKAVVKFKSDNGITAKSFTIYFTHHGPVMGSRDGKWLSLRANNRSLDALLESWQITKANTFEEYKKAMGLLSNATNNTVYADDKGNTAFWYGNYVPKRDPKIDWTLPVDGTVAATEWLGVHPLNEIVHVYNPQSGFIQNCNATPYASAGASSPDKAKYPVYMAPDGQNYRGVNAIKLLSDARGLTLDALIAKGYDHYLAAFDDLLPPLFKAYDQSGDSVKQALADPIKLLKDWDKHSSVNSVATTVATQWGMLMLDKMPRPKTVEEGTFATTRISAFAAYLDGKTQIGYLLYVVNNLQKTYGTWKVPLGEINRYQRPDDGKTFDDSRPSLPVGQVSSAFGQLPSFVSRQMGTQKRYGYSGNSFIATVEFGKRIKAKSIITGGQSFDPNSKHFTDQAQMYIDGRFKDVLFYKEDVLKHAERTYHPGE